MFEVTQYKEINKGSLKGTFNLKIPKWGNFIIRDMLYFKNDKNRWLSFPGKEYVKDDQKKYYQYNVFEDPETDKAFKAKAMDSLDFFFSQNQGIEMTQQMDEAPPF
jgi:hypothetical protein